MKREQDAADAAVAPALVFWSRLIQAAAAVVSYIWFANGIIGAVMAGWMICIILLARGPYAEGRLHAWNDLPPSGVPRRKSQEVLRQNRV